MPDEEEWVAERLRAAAGFVPSHMEPIDGPEIRRMASTRRRAPNRRWAATGVRIAIPVAAVAIVLATVLAFGTNGSVRNRTGTGLAETRTCPESQLQVRQVGVVPRGAERVIELQVSETGASSCTIPGVPAEVRLAGPTTLLSVRYVRPGRGTPRSLTLAGREADHATLELTWTPTCPSGVTSVVALVTLERGEPALTPVAPVAGGISPSVFCAIRTTSGSTVTATPMRLARG